MQDVVGLRLPPKYIDGNGSHKQVAPARQHTSEHNAQTGSSNVSTGSADIGSIRGAVARANGGPQVATDDDESIQAIAKPRGRPPGTKNKRKADAAILGTDHEQGPSSEPLPPKPRGRPPGTKNKPKPVTIKGTAPEGGTSSSATKKPKPKQAVAINHNGLNKGHHSGSESEGRGKRRKK